VIIIKWIDYHKTIFATKVVSHENHNPKWTFPTKSLWLVIAMSVCGLIRLSRECGTAEWGLTLPIRLDNRVTKREAVERYEGTCENTNPLLKNGKPWNWWGRDRMYGGWNYGLDIALIVSFLSIDAGGSGYTGNMFRVPGGQNGFSNGAIWRWWIIDTAGWRLWIEA